MHILHLSDTHGQHHKLSKLPNADIIIHSGDVSFAGSEDEVEDFIQWFCELPHKYKVFIAGNHDNYLYEHSIGELPKNCFYLCNSQVEIEGITLYGLPLFLEEVMSGHYDENIQKIPSNIAVLITHQPPYSILDRSAGVHYGSAQLLEKVMEIKPKYHLFGHVHDAYGVYQKGKTTFINSGLLNTNYDLVYEPQLVELNH